MSECKERLPSQSEGYNPFGSRPTDRFLPKQPEMPVLAELDWVTMGMLADCVEAQAGGYCREPPTVEHGMNSDRQQTFAIIGSTVGTVLASTISIATLIVTQHDAMRRSTDEQHAALRASAEQEHAALRGDIADIRGDIVEIRGDIRVIRSDISDLRERTARIEVHVGVTPESR